MSEEMTYEKIIARLEAILKELEKPDIELSKSLGLFEEGVALTNRCNKILDEAQQKVKVLTANSRGEVLEQDFQERTE